jgi:plasmid replication initiation protein
MPKLKKELVVKSNRLIEASYRLTLNEQRIILYSICRAREEQKGLFPDLPVTITADTFAKQFPSINSEDKTNVYRQLKEAMDTLYERSVTFYDIDPATGMDRVNKTRWISKASYIDGAGHVQVIFTQDVVKYFTRLETEFTSYHIEKVSGMTSSYAVRIYEVLVQFLTVGTRTLEISWLRDALQMSEDEYKLTANFKKWIIDVAVDQINKHTDLSVSYKPQKTGRAITAFVFKIKSKDNTKKSKLPRIDDAYLSKHARPGETRDQAFRRLLEERGQQRLPDTE